MRLKEYRIPIPLNLDEYRLGQQWTELELLKESLQTCSTCITIYDNISEQERLDIINEKIPLTLKTNITSSTLMTHKKYNIKDQTPKFLELFFFKSKNDLILDEYSWDNWPYTLTIIENIDYYIRIIIQSYYRNNNLSFINNNNSQLYFTLNNEQIKYLKDYEIINIAERLDEKKDYRLDEDPTRNLSIKKPNILPLQLNTKWYENWSNNQSSMCVYKLIELIIFNENNDEKSFLTKTTNKILWSSIIKTQKMIYHRFHQKLISNIDKWIDKTLSDIYEEEKLLKKYILQQQQIQLRDLNKQQK
ncbi:unnamed protein product [Rotaria sordida]|uniref:Phosphatidylinositol transfer protein N-terminal domain-containing protein n=2 Tax=Rotaria sordida TaxID=392033 RepID=A0A819BRL1_9BILA|nr:unnamed protein product [Rotaria sordida]CAF3801304.1 unnamed protein product [Rotaria sordida]